MDKDRSHNILVATCEVIAQEGLPFISYDVIAKRAKVSRQLIRYYFPTKEDFMLAICDVLALAYRETMVDVARLSMPENRLDYLLDFFFGFLDGKVKPKDDKVYDAMIALAIASPAVRENLKAQYCLLGNVMAHEISVEHPQMRIADADQLSYLFVTLMHGHWKMVASLGLSEGHHRVTRNAIDRLIASYLEKPTQSDEQPDIWT